MAVTVKAWLPLVAVAGTVSVSVGAPAKPMSVHVGGAVDVIRYKLLSLANVVPDAKTSPVPLKASTPTVTNAGILNGLGRRSEATPRLKMLLAR